MVKYLLSVACCDLRWDGGSSAKVSMIESESGEEKEIGQTERVNGINPTYEKMFDIKCDDPDSKLLKIAILDEHDETRGVGTFTISKITEHPKNLGTLAMPSGRGTIVVHVIETSDEGSIKLTLKGKDLKNVEGFTNLRKSDPFYILSRPGPSTSGWTPVHTSEVIDSNLNPEWSEVEIKIRDLCNGDFEQPLKIEIFDHEKLGKKHVPMGSLLTCADQLSSMPPDQGISLTQGEEKVGDLYVVKVELKDCVDSASVARTFMEDVAIALQTRSAANAKAQELDVIKAELGKAKQAVEEAQAEADKWKQQMEVVEDEWSKAMAAAAASLSVIGGL